MEEEAGGLRGVWVAAGYFAAAGVLEVGLAIWELPRPLAFWPVWDALGRGIFYGLLALGLWRRIRLARSIAIVYCVAVVVTYAVVLGLAFAKVTEAVPASLVVKSLYEVPTAILMFPYLRSQAAEGMFTRSLLG